MSSGQWRVLVLLLVLLALEAVKYPTVANFFKNIVTPNVKASAA
jgi:hypothetical protein